MTRAPSPVRTLLMHTRGGAGGGGRGLLRATVAGSTADGLAEAEPGGGDAGRGAATAVHPASALAASAYLAILTDIAASRLSALGYVNMKPPAQRLLHETVTIMPHADGHDCRPGPEAGVNSGRPAADPPGARPPLSRAPAGLRRGGPAGRRRRAGRGLRADHHRRDGRADHRAGRA